MTVPPLAAGTVAVTCREVAKRWDASSGLPATSLELVAGEAVVVRGRSGSGKSTLLAVLAGFAAADAGEIVWARSIDARSWADVAVVFQVLAPLAELSVLENCVVALGARPGPDANRRATAELRALGLADELARPVDAISLGQLQRLAIARATVVRPTVLLVDEPTSHQDAANTALVLDALRRCVDLGAACLVASHDPDVVSWADRVVDLDGSQAA